MFLTFLWALPALRWRAASPRAPQANGWARLAGPAGNRGRGAHFRSKTRPGSPRPVQAHRGAAESITCGFCTLNGFLPPEISALPESRPKVSLPRYF